MTAMYDHLYVYLCQKESLLKYFDQTFYYAVLCGRSNHLSSVLVFAWKVTKKKGVSEKVELKFWQGYTIKSSPSSLVYLVIRWWLGLVIGGEINGVTGETQRRSRVPICWHELWRPCCPWNSCSHLYGIVNHSRAHQRG